MMRGPCVMGHDWTIWASVPLAPHPPSHMGPSTPPLRASLAGVLRALKRVCKLEMKWLPENVAAPDPTHLVEERAKEDSWRPAPSTVLCNLSVTNLSSSLLDGICFCSKMIVLYPNLCCDFYTRRESSVLII